MKPNIKTFSVGLTMLILASLGTKRHSSMTFANAFSVSSNKVKPTNQAINSKNASKETAHFLSHTNNTKPEKSYLVSSSYSPVTRNTFVEGAGSPK